MTTAPTHPRVSDRPRRRKGQGRVVFLAHREEIRAALQEGWPRAAVHARLQSVLGMSYQQFVRYVDRYLADAPHGTAGLGPVPHSTAPGRTAVSQPISGVGSGVAPGSPAASPTPPSSPAPPPDATPTAPTPGALPRFTYTPGGSARDKLV